MEKTNAGAGLMAVLSACISTHGHEVPRTLLCGIAVSRPDGDQAPVLEQDGPEREAPEFQGPRQYVLHAEPVRFKVAMQPVRLEYRQTVS